jgi:hypothetical protein
MPDAGRLTYRRWYFQRDVDVFVEAHPRAFRLLLLIERIKCWPRRGPCEAYLEVGFDRKSEDFVFGREIATLAMAFDCSMKESTSPWKNKP